MTPRRLHPRGKNFNLDRCRMLSKALTAMRSSVETVDRFVPFCSDVEGLFLDVDQRRKVREAARLLIVAADLLEEMAAV